MTTTAGHSQLLVRGAGLPLASFALNGAIYGTLLTRFPQIADRTGASEVAFGLVLFAGAVGGLVGAVLVPLLVRRVGDVHAVTFVGVAFAVLAVSVAWAPTVPTLAVCFVLMTVFDGGHDVAMNALAVRVQQRTRTPLMGRMHAVWSITLVGATLAGAAAIRLPMVAYVTAVVVVLAALQVHAWRRTDLGDARIVPDAQATDAEATRSLTARHGVILAVLPLAVAAVAASYVESPGQEWSGLLLDRGMGATAAVAALGPVAFSSGLVASRLCLDAALTRYAAGRVAGFSAAFVIVSTTFGFVATQTTESAWLVLAALAAAGLGVGPMFPLLFGAADHLAIRHGLSPAVTASVISACSRTGAISAPLVVGFTADAVGLPVVLVIMAVGAALIAPTLSRTFAEPPR